MPAVDPDRLLTPGPLRVMGVLNVTPDSFSDGGRHDDVDSAVAHGLRLVEHGADLVDVGGESTRPGADPVDATTEQARVLPVVEALAEAGVAVSIDTMHASTASAALDAGAVLVNDVSGGLGDPAMTPTVAERGVPFVAMHWRGPSAIMQRLARYDHVSTDVASELLRRVDELVAAGIHPTRIVLDPGIGFSKNAEHNWTLLSRLGAFVGLGHPVLLGASRKRFLDQVDGVAAAPAQEDAPADGVTVDPADPWEVPETSARHLSGPRDLATAATSLLAAQSGVWAVRVHDVLATRVAVGVWEQVRAAGESA